MHQCYRLPFIASVIAVAVVCLQGGTPVAAQVQQETSVITGAERVSSTGMRDTEVLSYPGTDIAYKAEYTYQPETGAERWMLSFYGFASQSTDFTRAERLLVWIDGQRRRIEELEARTQRMNGEVMEIQTAVLPPAVFQRMAEAEAVQLTVGPAEFDLTYPNRADMRAVVEQAHQITTSAAPQQRADNGGR